MSSSEETSSKFETALHNGLDHALTGFLREPTTQEARNSVYAALAKMIEDQSRRLIHEHLRVENMDGQVVVTLEGPLAHLLRDLFGHDALAPFLADYHVAVPGWTRPDENEPVNQTRTYIDPRTNRPTRGRPMI